jgi:hypothetical protein
MNERDGETERWGRKMGETGRTMEKREVEETRKRGDRVLLFELVSEYWYGPLTLDMAYTCN